MPKKVRLPNKMQVTASSVSSDRRPLGLVLDLSPEMVDVLLLAVRSGLYGSSLKEAADRLLSAAIRADPFLAPPPRESVVYVEAPKLPQ